MMKLLRTLFRTVAVFGVVTGVIYWFNLDMKLIGFIYPKMNDYYDNMDKEKLL